MQFSLRASGCSAGDVQFYVPNKSLSLSLVKDDELDHSTFPWHRIGGHIRDISIVLARGSNHVHLTVTRLQSKITRELAKNGSSRL